MAIEKRTNKNGRVYYMRTGEDGTGLASKADYEAARKGKKGAKAANAPAAAATPSRSTAPRKPRVSRAETADLDDLFNFLTRR